MTVKPFLRAFRITDLYPMDSRLMPDPKAADGCETDANM